MTFMYDGWLTLAGGFPPTLNTEVDPTLLKPNESPACYGLDCGADGYLKTGSIPVGTDRTKITKTVNSTTWVWAYNRLWRANGTVLQFNAPHYDDALFAQGLGKLSTDATIVEVLPCLGNSILAVTATGSHLLTNADDTRGLFSVGHFYQELGAADSTKILILDGVPFVSNSTGVFSFDGRNVKEWTRQMRDSLGSFAEVAIKANYQKKWIIGTSKFVIDTGNGNLYDYGTTGFLFTSRTLTHSNISEPFRVTAIALIIQHATGDGGTVSWETKFEEDRWKPEDDKRIAYSEGNYTRIELPISRTDQVANKFAMRITGLSASIQIKEIQVLVGGYCLNVPSK